jgi:hypothetical protein
MQGDPARENQPRYTTSLANVDLPASFYNIDQLVSTNSSLQFAQICRSAEDGMRSVFR